MLSIKITNPDDELTIRAFATKNRMPITKAVMHAIKLSEDIYLMQGQVATYKFMLKAMKEDFYSDKKKPR
jgi:hypothetical protein